MIHEKSCGAVIFRNFNNENLYLILEMNQGHFSLCKGHVENEENDYETATREIKEETNLDVEFLTAFKEHIAYSPYPGCEKDVYFFLAEAKTNNVLCQVSEVKHAYWLNYEDALKRITHDSDKEVLKKAHDYLVSMK